MMTIALQPDGVALVSDQDYAYLSKFRWTHCRDGYATNEQLVRMHELLMPRIPGLYVDHVDRDRLNCQRDNLRYITPKGNALNNSGKPGQGTAWVGVQWIPEKGKYRANIRAEGKNKFLGYFNDPEEAAVVVGVYRQVLIRAEVLKAQVHAAVHAKVRAA